LFVTDLVLGDYSKVMSAQREDFDDFAERAEEELGDSLRKLFLFGSVAGGEERVWSTGNIRLRS
jgi:predicted nucleotidyltransferase